MNRFKRLRRDECNYNLENIDFLKFDLNNCRRCPDSKTDKKRNKENKKRE
jgi:hypothetical protein